MKLITVRISDELKRKMDQYPHINWSEVVRRAIEERIKIEESIPKRKIDLERLRRAIVIQDEIRSKTSGKWSVTEEIRKWREKRL